MRTNKQGYPIQTFGNHPQDYTIVHVPRDDLQQSTDYNGVVMSNGKVYTTLSLDHARATSHKKYKNEGEKLPANYRQILVSHEALVRKVM